MLKMIFVHVPKCGGTSVVRALAATLGDAAIHADNGDSPANPASDISLDPEGSAERFASQADQLLAGRAVAYGHLHAAKYLRAAPDVPLVTVLRDPVERVISHYFFWKQPGSWHPNPLREYAERYALSLVDFARLPAMRGFYRHRFFAGLERSQFAIVGRTESMQDFTNEVSTIVSVSLGESFENIGLARLGSAALEEIEATRPILDDLLADETEFYLRWTES